MNSLAFGQAVTDVSKYTLGQYFLCVTTPKFRPLANRARVGLSALIFSRLLWAPTYFTKMENSHFCGPPHIPPFSIYLVKPVFLRTDDCASNKCLLVLSKLISHQYIYSMMQSYNPCGGNLPHHWLPATVSKGLRETVCLGAPHL